MKSAMRRSLAMLLTVLMMLSVCALSLQMVVLAATTDMDDNQPCDCGATVTTKVVAPTCVDLGGTWHTCSECAKKWVTDVQLPTGQHDFSVGGTHEATCTEDGSVGYFCSVCNAASPDNTTTPALGHNYETVEIPSDCVNGGTITETCSRCGDTKETTTPATGHVHVAGNEAGVDYKAPTCSEEGFVNFTCSTCGDLVHAVFDKLEHAPNTEKVEPSCKDYGYEIGGVCTICGEVLDASKQLAKIDHDYKDLTATEKASNGEAGYQAPVCSTAGTTDGWQWQVCKVCEYENKVTIPASHSFEFKETVASNCATKSNGYDLYECSVCGTPEHRNEVAYAHKYPTSAIGVSVLYTFILKDASVAASAIVGSDGNSYYSFDGKSVYYTDDSSESYAGYEQVLWVVQRIPTKDLHGILVHACEICDVSAHLNIEIDHENPVYVSTVDPNCTEQGYDVYTCDCCVGGFKTNYTDALGHRDYDGYRHKDCPTTGIKVDRVEPDCATGTQGKTEYYYCTDPACPVAGLYNATYTEIPATHTYTASTYKVPASCAFPSFVIQACTCGAIEYDLDTAAGMVAAYAARKSVVSGSTFLGHDWSKDSPYVVVEKEKVEATCTTPGNEEFHKCTLCGDTDSLSAIVIPVLGEKYVVKETVKSTCRVQGYTVYTCGNVDWANGETCSVHADYTVYDDQHKASNGGHLIKDAVYNATTGRVDVSGATLLTAADLIALGVISSEAEYSTSWGSCDENVNLLHHGWYECSVCGDPYFFAVKRVHTPGASATCNNPQNCTECGKTLTEQLDHDWQLDSTTGATCTTDTIEHYECSRNCGVATKHVTIEGSALNHDYVDGISTPTCTAGVACTRCSYSVAKLDHKIAVQGTFISAYEKVTTDPTCTQNGVHTYTCSLCNHVYTESIDALGHDFSVEIGIADRDATCTLYGYKNIRACANEGCTAYHGTDFAAAKDHKDENGNSTYVKHEQKVSCMVDGFSYEQCSQCQHKKNEVIDSAPGYHTSSADMITHITLTCKWLTGKSEAARTCSECFATFEAEDYHDYHEIDVYQSCTEDGVRAKYCSLCSDTEIISKIEALGHNYQLNEAHEDYVAAQIAVGGMDVYTCVNVHSNGAACGDTYKEASDPLKGVIVSANAANKWNADAKIVNNGIIAYTISIKGMNVEFYSLKVDVSFDNTKLVYMGYNLGADAMNIFGNRVNTIGTEANEGVAVGDITTIAFYGFNQNNSTEQMVDVKLNGEQEFVTVYFRVKGAVRSDAETDVNAVETNITLGTVTCLTAADDKTTHEDDVATATVNAETVEIYKLGDSTDDAVIASEDLASIKEHIIAGTYDARIDVNVDGVITSEDLIILAQKYVYTYTYADLFDMALAYDPAVSDKA